jgi:hypothetical protein
MFAPGVHGPNKTGEALRTLFVLNSHLVFCKRQEFVSGLYKLRKTHPPEGYGL